MNGEERRSPEIRPSQVSFKTVFTVSFTVLFVVGLIYAISQAIVAVALIGAAGLIAISLEHLVRLLVSRGVGRQLAIALVITAVTVIIAGFALTLIPPAVEQCKQLIKDTPGFLRSMRASALFERLDLRFHIADQIDRAQRSLPNLLEGAASPVFSALGSVLTALGALVTIAVLVVFMLIFGGRLIDAAMAEARPERLEVYREVLHKIYVAIGGYLGGLMLICLCNAVCTTTFLAIDGVPFFLPLGILAGASSMVPYAGPLVVGSLISVIAFFTKGAWHGVAAAIYFVTYGQVEGNILGPLIFRRTVHVNPLVVTLSILFLGELAGIMGAIVAVPIVATMQIILRELLRIRREQLRLVGELPPEGA
ncbi:MAG TPA: AI-2E family transporter [Polyangia bacterium]|nr:AI-2E family transporter [Polyangia bacterium]